MDARAAGPRPVTVRLSDPGELAASVPPLLGFRPAESIVLLCLVGEDGSRLGLTLRADLPSAGHEAAAAGRLTAKAMTDGPAGVVAVVVSETADDPDGLPHRPLVHEVCLALTGHGVPMAEVLLVRDGRWWSYDCPAACCAPGAGTALPDGVTQLEAAAVATGVVVEPDRAALVARVAPPGPEGRRTIAEACATAAVHCADTVVERGWAALADDSWAAVLDALARFRPGAPTPGTRLTDAEVARLLWGLRDRNVRDRALALALGEHAAAAEQLWTECTRRAPAPLDAAPSTLLAVSCWLRGDGAMADVALTRALAGDPDYALARLLAQALEACVRPAQLRELVRRATADRAA
jgi:hypothetical protein